MIKLLKLYRENCTPCKGLDIKLKDLKKDINLPIVKFDIESDIGCDLGTQMKIKTTPALALVQQHEDGEYTIIQKIDHEQTVENMLKDITGIIHA